MPVKAYAYENEQSDIWVGDTQMIKNGKLLQNTVYGNQGTATYDLETNTLTLDKLEINDP